jgi:hypothetical protein
MLSREILISVDHGKLGMFHPVNYLLLLILKSNQNSLLSAI